MIIRIKAFPKSKRSEVVTDKQTIKVFVKEPAERGKANRAIIRLLSDYFGTEHDKVKILGGLKSSNKIVELKA